MQYWLLLNSGYNRNNVPDSYSKILYPDGTENYQIIKGQTIDIIQSRSLQKITIKANYQTACMADYLIIDDPGIQNMRACYFVNNVIMNSRDICTLELEFDALTTIGIANLQLLDGVTERVHITKGEDKFGAFTEADPIFTPAKPLKIMQTDPFFVSNTSFANLVESTVDLWELGRRQIQNSLNSTVYKSSDENFAVTLLNIPQAEQRTLISMDGARQVRTPGTMLFDLANYNVQRGVQLCRDYGIESAIVAQYQLPYEFFRTTLDTTNPGFIREIVCLFSTENVTDYLPLYDDAKISDGYNMRCFYGEWSKYGIVSTSGDKVEADAAKIYDGTNIKINAWGDPREDGSPYFGFGYMDGRPIDTPQKSMTNVIKGSRWKNCPLIYTKQSGNVLNQNIFELEERRRSAERSQAYINEGIERAVRGVSNMGKFAGTVTGFSENPLNLFGNVAQLGADYGREELGYYAHSQNIRTATEKEALYAHYAGMQYVAPQIYFPIQNDTMRDFFGNGAICYRYDLSDTDRDQYNRLLNMYGYKVTRPLKMSDFTNRTKFNYVSAYNISIGNEIPQWIKDTIKRQLEGGVRIWHVKPSDQYYEVGQNG